MTLRTWNTIMELCGMALGVGVIVILLWTILFAGGCGSVSRVPVGDSGSDEGLEDDPEVGEELLDGPEADGEVEEDLVEAVEDTTEEDVAGDEFEVPCGGLTEDCDGDGLTPLGGDCCDSDYRVHPMQADWFYEANACPGREWDYDCSDVVEYQYADYGGGLDATVPFDCDGATYDDCAAVYTPNLSGWNVEAPGCGETGEYVVCELHSTMYGWTCVVNHKHSFTMGCH